MGGRRFRKKAEKKVLRNCLSGSRGRGKKKGKKKPGSIHDARGQHDQGGMKKGSAQAVVKAETEPLSTSGGGGEESAARGGGGKGCYKSNNPREKRKILIQEGSRFREAHTQKERGRGQLFNRQEIRKKGGNSTPPKNASTSWKLYCDYEGTFPNI